MSGAKYLASLTGFVFWNLHQKCPGVPGSCGRMICGAGGQIARGGVTFLPCQRITLTHGAGEDRCNHAHTRAQQRGEDVSAAWVIVSAGLRPQLQRSHYYIAKKKKDFNTVGFFQPGVNQWPSEIRYTLIRHMHPTQQAAPPIPRREKEMDLPHGPPLFYFQGTQKAPVRSVQII